MHTVTLCVTSSSGTRSVPGDIPTQERGNEWRLLFFLEHHRRRRWTQADLGRELELLTVAHHLDGDLVGGLDPRHLVHRATAVAGRFAVDAEDHVAQLQAGFLGRAVAEDPRHD